MITIIQKYILESRQESWLQSFFGSPALDRFINRVITRTDQETSEEDSLWEERDPKKKGSCKKKKK